MRKDTEHTMTRVLMTHIAGRRKDGQRPGGKMSVRDMNKVGLKHLRQ